MESLQAKDFSLELRLARSRYTQVYRAKNKQKEVLAIKIIDLSKLSLKEDEIIMREVNIWKQIDHPNIITYYGSFLDKTNLWLKCEYMDGNSLRSVLDNRFPDGLEVKYVLAITKEVLSALVYLHQNKIIHRDLKAANIEVESIIDSTSECNSQKEIKVCDFGVSRKFETTVGTFTGTRCLAVVVSAGST